MSQTARSVIELTQLSKYYGKVRGIEAVDLSVRAGSIFGFIGPNGAGKSTTIRLLLNLIRPDRGTITVFGEELGRHDHSYLQRIGYLPSEAIFYPSMTARQVIRYSAELRGQAAVCEAEANVLIERFDLPATRRIKDLSLGNRKKVGIICALQHKPELLLLDEPTAGLDPLMQQAFWKLIHERQAEGSTVFLSSHTLSEVQQHCDEAAIIRDGRIVSSGKVQELLADQAKRITLRGLSADSLQTLHTIAGDNGIMGLAQEGEAQLSFLFHGELPHMVRQLSTLTYQDLTIAEPDLEEIFLHYYEQEGTS